MADTISEAAGAGADQISASARNAAEACTARIDLSASEPTLQLSVTNWHCRIDLSASEPTLQLSVTSWHCKDRPISVGADAATFGDKLVLQAVNSILDR